MSFIGASFSTLNLFRTIYQGKEIVDIHLIGQSDTVLKIGIALTDFYSSILTPIYYKFFSPSSPVSMKVLFFMGQLEGGLRFIEMSRSCYLLYTNPPGIDHQTHQLNILLNALNIARLALQTLQIKHLQNSSIVYLKLAVQGIDVILRVSSGNMNASLINRTIAEFTLFATSICMAKKMILTSLTNQHVEISIAMAILIACSLPIVQIMTDKFCDYFNISSFPFPDPFSGRISSNELAYLGACAFAVFTMNALIGNQSVDQGFRMIFETLKLGHGGIILTACIYKIYQLASGLEPVLNINELKIFGMIVGFNLFMQAEYGSITNSEFMGSDIIDFIKKEIFELFNLS